MGYGELAAILTAFCWTICSAYFEEGGKKIGSFNLNMTRLLFALFYFTIFNIITEGAILPYNLTFEVLTFMSISGFLGIFLGDLLLFEAFVLLSARITLLIFFTVPPITSLLSFIFIGDKMELIEIISMMIILLGIYLVVGKKEVKEKTALSKKGLALAFGAAFLQASANVISKYVVVDYNPFFSSQIRVIAGICAFALLYTFKGHWKTYIETFKNKEAMIKISIGAFFGPFLGITLTLISLQYINAGISSILSSISPIILIPYTVFIKKEKISKYDIIGTLIAFVGLSIIV